MGHDPALGRLAARDYQAYVETFADTPGVRSRPPAASGSAGRPIDDDYLNGVFGAGSRRRRGAARPRDRRDRSGATAALPLDDLAVRSAPPT